MYEWSSFLPPCQHVTHAHICVCVCVCPYAIILHMEALIITTTIMILNCTHHHKASSCHHCIATTISSLLLLSLANTTLSSSLLLCYFLWGFSKLLCISSLFFVCCVSGTKEAWGERERIMVSQWSSQNIYNIYWLGFATLYVCCLWPPKTITIVTSKIVDHRSQEI